MARLLGPDMGSRLAYDPDTGRPARNATAVVYTNSAGTVLADIRVYDGSMVPGAVILGSTVVTDSGGLLPLFWYPDGDVDRLYASVDGGPVTPIDADYNARLDGVAVLAGRGAYNILAEGAVAGDVGSNAATNAAAFSAANEKARVSGGTVYFPRGVYQTNQTLTLYSNVAYVGDAGTRIKLANGANTDLFKTQSFDSLFAGSTQGGPSRFLLRDLILDGNAANQTSGYVLSIYGSNYHVNNVQVINGKQGGVRSRWGTGGTNMEAHWSNFKIYNNGGVQLDHQGPHDSTFVNGQIFMDGSQTPAAGRYGLRMSGNATGDQISNVHIWGFHEVGWYIQQSNVKMLNTVAEGAKINVWLDANDCIWNGDIFGTNGTGTYAGTEVGVRIGTLGSGITRWGNRVRGIASRWAAGDFPVDFASDNGTDVDLTLRIGNATAAYTGTPHYKSLAGLHILCPDSPQFSISARGFSGNGLPNGSLGVVGSYYHRWDGTTGSRIYHKTAVGTWTAIL